MLFRLPEHRLETPDLARNKITSSRCQPIVPASRVFVTSPVGRFDEPLVQESLEIVVERPRSKLVSSVRLAGDFLHYSVTVALFPGKRQENMQSRGKQRCTITHNREQVYRNPTELQHTLIELSACNSMLLADSSETAL